MMWTSVLLFAFLSTSYADYPSSNQGPSGSKFSQVTQFSQVRLAAFVDVNNDRRTDAIVVNANNGIDVLIEPDARQSSSFVFSLNAQIVPTRTHLLNGSSFSKKIRAIVPSDFNGDSVADLLVLTGDSIDSDFTAYLCFGENKDNFKLQEPVELETTFKTQPLVGDFNADGIADIYGEISPGKRGIFYGGSERKLVRDKKDQKVWSAISYAAFGDFQSSSTPSAMILTDDKSLQFMKNAFQSNVNEAPDTSTADTINLPTNEVIGQFRFADFNRDGSLDFILPVCETADCSSSALHIYEFNKKKWTKLTLNLAPPGFDGRGKWAFTKRDASLDLSTPLLSGITHGDVDSDGFTDLTAILTYTEGSNVYTVPTILLNSGFNRDGSFAYKFQAYLLPGVEFSSNSIVQMGLFDQNEDGILDIWITTMQSSSNAFNTRLLLQVPFNNNYFLMAMVLSGLCPNNPKCMGYGIPIPGSSVYFETYSISGSLVRSIGVTAPLTTCNSLELPYILFGVGEVANYIEVVKFRTLSNQPALKPSLQHTQEFTVPDAQLVLNPHPRQDPSSWRVTSFLQPLRNMKVVFIAVTLLCLMLILTIAISIMQCLEMREDREEKLQQTQGFHF